jgi:type I restriction enzyme R subunit
MTNFGFLNTPDWRDLYTAAVKAEYYTLSDPRTALFYGRRAVEVLVEWLYAYDPAFHRPYDDGLNALMADASFRAAVPPAIQTKLHALRKLGNTAVHDRKAIRAEQSVAMIRELHHIAYWFARTYTSGDPNTVPGAFDESRLPPSRRDKATQTRAQLKTLAAELEARDEALRSEQANSAALQAEIDRMRAAVSITRVVNEVIPDTHDYSEAETRELLIDLSLREAGWDPHGDHVAEYRVSPFPNKQGFGKVDYVLWGEDGLPLAVVEAKRTTVDKDRGRQQAKLYADALEEMHGQRPIIFYTNGYEITLWDDERYPPRDVQGFYTRDELQWLIQQRTLAQELSTVTVNPAIVDRYYQLEAIRRFSEHLSEGHRRGLLVMATGTGKTRVAVATVDLLMRAGWVRRVLFLADRRELVRQAIRAFNRFLPSSNASSLLEGDEAADSRVVVSTYHTIMNQIDAADDTGQRLFTPGHFDLIIIDEAHRSVYQKFGAIFDYFDSLLLGLTATPRDDVDRNTYGLFRLEQGVPTYFYELDDAVGDGFLVPPRALETETRFLREGIHYDELSDEEQAEWDLIEWGDSGEIPDAIEASALNAWLFNEDTVDQVLKTLMAHGLRVAGGDRLAKTIIFARNHRHAAYIAERFNANYPHYRGRFAQLIDNTVNYAETLIDDFKNPAKEPQIAISVDMLDTGIDVPEVANLVFFKPLRSKIKFWQMIGRGTRLSPNLFGPGQDKEHFLLFDFCGNLEFFRYNPQGVKDSAQAKPLRQRLFELRLDLLMALQAAKDPGLEPLRQETAAALHAFVVAMNLDNFIVRPARRYVEPFRVRERWNHLSQTDLGDLRRYVGPLPSELPDDTETAKQFDLLVLSLQLAQIERKGNAVEALRNRIVNTAGLLEAASNIPAVRAQEQTIARVQTEAFWSEATLPELEDLRQSLRGLTQFIEKGHKDELYTDFTDEAGQIRESMLPEVADGINKAQYRKKVEQAIRAHQDDGVIRKIRLAEPLTPQDLADLEAFFYSADGVESHETFVQIYGQPLNLAAFVRSLVGLDRKAAKERFAAFLDQQAYTADQIQFVNIIIDHLTRNGTMSPALLYERPFTDVHYAGLDGLFDDHQAGALVSVIEDINHSVTVL